MNPSNDTTVLITFTIDLDTLRLFKNLSFRYSKIHS